MLEAAKKSSELKGWGKEKVGDIREMINSAGASSYNLLHGCSYTSISIPAVLSSSEMEVN